MMQSLETNFGTPLSEYQGQGYPEIPSYNPFAEQTAAQNAPRVRPPLSVRIPPPQLAPVFQQPPQLARAPVQPPLQQQGAAAPLTYPSYPVSSASSAANYLNALQNQLLQRVQQQENNPELKNANRGVDKLPARVRNREQMQLLEQNFANANIDMNREAPQFRRAAPAQATEAPQQAQVAQAQPARRGRPRRINQAAPAQVQQPLQPRARPINGPQVPQPQPYLQVPQPQPYPQVQPRRAVIQPQPQTFQLPPYVPTTQELQQQPFQLPPYLPTTQQQPFQLPPYVSTTQQQPQQQQAQQYGMPSPLPMTAAQLQQLTAAGRQPSPYGAFAGSYPPPLSPEISELERQFATTAFPSSSYFASIYPPEEQVENFFGQENVNLGQTTPRVGQLPRLQQQNL